jgi:hypothetical protein
MGEATKGDALITEAGFQQAIDRLGPQSAVKPHLLFLRFPVDKQLLVDQIAHAFDDVNEMLTAALAHVGQSNSFSLSPYELLFGKRSLRSGASYAQRETKVTNVLRAIQAGLMQNWTIKYDEIANDIASFSGGNRIAVGKAWGGGGKFAAGFLIHEMGHWAGLVDVCSLCCDAQIRTKHFQAGYTTAQLNCLNNRGHATRDRIQAGQGHFIGYKRAKLLATTQKNLTVWNADSYRWYCYQFFKTEVTNSLPAGNSVTW